MARMGKYGYTSAGSTQLSAKIEENLKADFADTCDQNGETMTNVIEQLMAGYVADHGNAPVSTDHLPDDDRLRAGYQRLRELADPDTHSLPTESALSDVAEECGVKKAAVKRTILQPLERRDYIEANWGTIKVVPPHIVAGTTPDAVATDGGEDQ